MLVAPMVLLAQLGIAEAARADTAPEVIVTTVTSALDQPLTGRLVGFSFKDGLRLETPEAPEPVVVPAADVIFFAVQGVEAAVRPSPDQVRLRLAGGDLLYGRPAGANGDQVVIESRLLGRMSVPLERIDSWSRGPGLMDRGRQDTDSAPAEEDVLRLSNGDSVRGTVTGIDEAGFTLDTESGPIQVAHERLAAADLVAEPSPAMSGLRAHLHMADGSRITAREIEFAAASFTITPLGGQPLNCAFDRLERIEVAGGRWVWLSELDPVSGQYTPMMTLDRPYLRNANAYGRPMRIAGRPFAHGIGVHAESRLMYEVAGQYRELVLWLGIDDAGGAYSDVTAEIRVDGRSAFHEVGLRHGRVVGPIRIDLTGAGRIELAALFGDNAGIQDCFNWADAGLVR